MMWGVAAIGFFSGIISGMGIGGGTILIPALLFLTEVNQQQENEMFETKMNCSDVKQNRRRLS